MWDTVNHGRSTSRTVSSVPSIAVDLRTRHVQQLELASSRFLCVDLGAYYY